MSLLLLLIAHVVLECFNTLLVQFFEEDLYIFLCDHPCGVLFVRVSSDELSKLLFHDSYITLNVDLTLVRELVSHLFELVLVEALHDVSEQIVRDRASCI